MFPVLRKVQKVIELWTIVFLIAVYVFPAKNAQIVAGEDRGMFFFLRMI